MKYVSVIQDNTYLLWQQELQAFNFRKLGMLDQLVAVVLHEPGTVPSARAKHLATLMEVHFFENTQLDRTYAPSNKPFGLQKLLEKAPWYGRRVFLLDSDVIFREKLDFKVLDGVNDDDPTWYVSDTIGYIAHHYLKEHLGEAGVEEMAKLVGLSGDRLKEEQANSGGAQYYMKNLTPEFCRMVTEDSLRIHRWALEQKRPNNSFKIQVWTAEMWAWLWNGFRVASVKVSPEMAFAWAPHVVSDWTSKKLLHLAGVTGAEKGCFFKGKYHMAAPWEVEKDFYFVDRSRCWAPYVELIEEYKQCPTSQAFSPSSSSVPPRTSGLALPSVILSDSSRQPRRAAVAYVDRRPDLIAQAKMLYQSLLYSRAEDTDLVLFGPLDVLQQLPTGPQLVKIVQDPHPLAKEYGFINSISCFNYSNSQILDRYQFVLKTDVDTFLTPAWNRFRPERPTCGVGMYSNSDLIRAKCKHIAASRNLIHRGWHNLGSTIYGETQLVKQVCDLATRICEWLILDEFKDDPGAWPGWFKGVSSMYATEIALNHLVPELVGLSRSLDYFSTSTDSVQDHPHIHCWHTDAMYSKFKWTQGTYAGYDESSLNLDVIRDYCLAMALRSKG